MHDRQELNGQVNPFVAIRAILRSDLTSASKVTLLAIFDKAGNGSGVCTASYATLGQMTGRTRRKTYATIPALVSKGWIKVQARQTAKGDHASNAIRLGPAFLRAVKSQIALEKRSNPGDLSVPTPGDQMVPTPVTFPSLPQGPNGPYPRDQMVPQTSPLNVPMNDSIKRGGEPPPKISSPPIWDPRQQEVIDLATSRWGVCNGDFVVGDLLHTYSAELVMEAIDRHWAKVGTALKPALLMATCRGMLADGWKPENGAPHTGNGKLPKRYGIFPGP